LSEHESGARPAWRRLGAAGVLAGLYEPDGRVDRERLAALLAELDARHPPGVVLSVCVQVSSALPLLWSAAGGNAVARGALDRALAGEAVVALAATDAAVAGSALLEAGTAVRLDEDKAVVAGGKEWITNAMSCDVALVLARHRPQPHVTSFTWVLVPAGHAGVSREAVPTRGLAEAGLGHLRFDEVRLGRDHVLGRPGRALAQFARHMGTERLAGALWARALCRRVLADTHRYLRGRSAGGRTVLWDNAAVRERFARCLVEWSRLDALCAAHLRADLSIAGGMLLKAAYAEGVDRILGECVNLRGADALRSGGLADLRADAALFGIAGGATGTMLAGVADHADQVLPC
jgi:acyl-CoA dehydrogenase